MNTMDDADRQRVRLADFKRFVLEPLQQIRTEILKENVPGKIRRVIELNILPLEHVLDGFNGGQVPQQYINDLIEILVDYQREHEERGVSAKSAVRYKERMLPVLEKLIEKAEAYIEKNDAPNDVEMKAGRRKTKKKRSSKKKTHGRRV